MTPRFPDQHEERPAKKPVTLQAWLVVGAVVLLIVVVLAMHLAQV